MNTGVVVGRFQLDSLHLGHKDLIKKAAYENDKLVIVLGEGPLPSSTNNPLDTSDRYNAVASFLVEEDFKNWDILILKDHPSDQIWSENLDKILNKYHDPVLYHSRDSFAQYYTGIYPTKEVKQAEETTATELRKNIGITAWASSLAFRRGVIWSTQQRFPTVYSTVDTAVFKYHKEGSEIKTELLVITKEHLEGYMFPGGFAEVGSESDEDDALREVLEETGIVAKNPEYLGSFKQDDWRYRGEVDEIRTRLFAALYESGEPKGNDDASTAQWIDFDTVDVLDFNECHQPLIQKIWEVAGQ